MVKIKFVYDIASPNGYLCHKVIPDFEAKHSVKFDYFICLLGGIGGRAKKLANMSLVVKSNNVARIQETHIFLSHFILEEVEKRLIKKKKI